MVDETKVRVGLDTKQASGQLRGFVRESERAAERVSLGVRGALGKGLGFVGLGGAIGVGLGAIKGATASGLGDILGESLGRVGAEIENAIFGDLSAEARASAKAREATVQSFGMVAGASGSDGGMPPGAREFYESIRRVNLQMELGRKKLNLDPALRPEQLSVQGIKNGIMVDLALLVQRGVEELTEALK